MYKQNFNVKNAINFLHKKNDVEIIKVTLNKNHKNFALFHSKTAKG
jgi:hypothetical protein